MKVHRHIQHPGFQAGVCLEVQSLIPPRGGQACLLVGFWLTSRLPEFPQGLLFKGKLVCLQLDPWATFDSCSKNNKTDGQNRFWGLHPNCHPQWNLKQAWGWWGAAATYHCALPLTSKNHSFLPEDENCHHIVFSWWEFSLAVRK